VVVDALKTLDIIGTDEAGEPARRPDSVGGGASRHRPERPSIWDQRCRRPRAAYPQTRTGRPRTPAARPCSRWGLPSRAGHPARWWSLTPPFHPYPHSAEAEPLAVCLCGTVPRVTSGGRYPPPCPTESGPSSMRRTGRAPRPPGRLTRPVRLAEPPVSRPRSGPDGRPGRHSPVSRPRRDRAATPPNPTPAPRSPDSRS
jgi:hypothetical protein